MTLEELKKYVAELRERYFKEKGSWAGETVLVENTHLKGMEYAIELLEKGKP